jgi:hypothetical protein
LNDKRQKVQTEKASQARTARMAGKETLYMSGSRREGGQAREARQ